MEILGEQYVLHIGVILMLKLCVDSSGIILLLVSIIIIINQAIFLYATGASSVYNNFGKGTGLVHSFRFSCSGSEISLLNCTYYSESSCSIYFSHYAGVECEGMIIIMSMHASSCSNNIQLLALSGMFV